MLELTRVVEAMIAAGSTLELLVLNLWDAQLDLCRKRTELRHAVRVRLGARRWQQAQQRRSAGVLLFLVPWCHSHPPGLLAL